MSDRPGVPDPSRALPPRASLEQLRKRAKELLAAYRAGDAEAAALVARHERRAAGTPFALHDAQRVLARSYGFESWPRLKRHLEGLPRAGAGADARRPIRPRDVADEVWDVITAAAEGDLPALRALLDRDPALARAEYWYTPPLHFAVREGHAEAVRLLLDAGADPGFVSLGGDSLLATARDRGHHEVAALLETAIARRARTAAAGPGSPDHEVHEAAEADDTARLRRLLDADPQLVGRGDRRGATPLHRAAAASARRAVELLLDRGADVDALHGDGGGDASGYPPRDHRPVDLALFRRGDVETARRLLARGARSDLVVAAALGDTAQITALLDADPDRIEEVRPCGTRPLTAAVLFGHADAARLLLERGADPCWPEADAPRGAALHTAARAGRRDLAELLLEHGADPNAGVDSAGSATFAARTPELRTLLMAHGGTLDAFDLVWLDEDEEAVRRVRADPGAADAGCGGALAAACKRGKRDLVVRLLEAGARVPPVLTACRSYLLEDPELLELLLASGMDPDLPDWQRATPLHALCGRDSRRRPHPRREACAAVLLDAGASLTARDLEYRSTPLGWAARCDLPDMVELLLARGAPAALPDDPDWATPLAWATRRGHAAVADLLRRAGARD